MRVPPPTLNEDQRQGLTGLLAAVENVRRTRRAILDAPREVPFLAFQGLVKASQDAKDLLCASAEAFVADALHALEALARGDA